MFGKPAVAVNTGGHSIRVLNERSARDGKGARRLAIVLQL